MPSLFSLLHSVLANPARVISAPIRSQSRNCWSREANPAVPRAQYKPGDNRVTGAFKPTELPIGLLCFRLLPMGSLNRRKLPFIRATLKAGLYSRVFLGSQKGSPLDLILDCVGIIHRSSLIEIQWLKNITTIPEASLERLT